MHPRVDRHTVEPLPSHGRSDTDADELTLSTACTSSGQFEVVVFDGKSGRTGKPAQLVVEAASCNALHATTHRTREVMMVATWTDGISVAAAGMNPVKHPEVG